MGTTSITADDASIGGNLTVGGTISSGGAPANLTLLNGWTLGGGYAKSYLNAIGHVEVELLVTAPNPVVTTVAQLPSGQRPGTHPIYVAGNDDGAAAAISVKIDTSGNIIVPVTFGNGDVLSLVASFRPGI